MEKSFKEIFNNKGRIAPISEKACKNFRLKAKSPVNVQDRLHYFAIGHAFKNIDGKNVFGFKLDETKKKVVPTRFLTLQRDYFDFQNDLNRLTDDIRNINSHYVHSFEKIELKAINTKIVQFLSESFEIAATHSYLYEKELTYEDFLKNKNSDKVFVQFLCDKFYPNKEHQKEERAAFSSKTKKEAVEYLLFIDVTADFDWTLFEKHTVFKITIGKYLSFYACLFLLSMFLYKSEANQLISKIKGFKRNDDNEYRSKRNIFTFFSKKFSSQDVNSEDKHLVKFRDLVQYLNHYPAIWKEELKLKPNFPVMTNQLKKYIIKSEIERSFPNFAGDNKFLLFSIKELFGNSQLKNWIGDKNINFTKEEIKVFSYEINTASEIKDAEEKLVLLNKKASLSQKEKGEKRKLESKIKIAKKENISNPVKDKLLNRIEKNMLFISYGRNQDRFMDFATRFLAENNYFGKEALFKMYRFYTTSEQEEFLKEQKKILNNKEFDKFKYHQGKLVHYDTYNNHLNNYPEWDTPFVIENNAIQVKLNLLNGSDILLSVQRNLMLYLLEDALYTFKIENAGKSLMNAYFNHHQKEFNEGKAILEQSESISDVRKEQKENIKKLFSKRLLRNYLPVDKNNEQEFSALQLILEKAKLEEERYELLFKEAKKHKTEEDFLKRNKGKQFKLRFVRKAWHLMYFREMYLKQAEASGGHHKRFHINKEEFNDFSRWMFAFDEVSKYKEYLSHLFNEKGFFNNSDFKDIFDSGSSLNDLYEKSKSIFEVWLLKNNVPIQKEGKYQLVNYQLFFDSKILYINISHFIKYLESNNKLKRNKQGIIEYKALANNSHLIGDYYYKEKLNTDEYKSCGKLYNKLKTAKLEDALLYEMALFYLNIDKTIIQKTKTNVKHILASDIKFDIIDANDNHLYNLVIPFNKIDSFIGMINYKTEEEKKFKGKSFLTNIKDYLEKVKDNKDIRRIYQSYNRNPKTLRYEDLDSINRHIMTKSTMFTKVALKLEEYFIVKDRIEIRKDNRITIREISELKQYFDSVTRNNAFHFGIPDMSYNTLVSKLETKFIQNEIKPTNPKSFDSMSKGQQALCNLFLEMPKYNSFFGRMKKTETEEQKKDRISNVRKKYFDDVI